MIGGINGHSEKVLEKKDYEISFSKLTFYNNVAMIILVETLYRSFSILKNYPYYREWKINAKILAFIFLNFAKKSKFYNPNNN